MILTESRDGDVHNQEEASSGQRNMSLLCANNDDSICNLEQEEIDACGIEMECRLPPAVSDMKKSPRALTRSGSTTSHASIKKSNSANNNFKMKAPAVLYRSRTAVRSAVKKPDNMSLTGVQEQKTPGALSRSRTATPQIWSDKSAPTFHDMMKLVALSRAKSIKVNPLPTVAEPEDIEEVETVEEEENVATIDEFPTVEALTLINSAIIPKGSSTYRTLIESQEKNVTDAVPVPDADTDTDTEVEDPEDGIQDLYEQMLDLVVDDSSEIALDNDSSDDFAAVEVVEVVELIEEIEVELDEEGTYSLEQPSVSSDDSDMENNPPQLDYGFYYGSQKPHHKKSKWSKMRKLLKM